MKRCGYCGGENADEAVSCTGCGTTLNGVAPLVGTTAKTGTNPQKRRIMPAQIIPVFVGCLVVATIWYWQTYLTYTGEVSHFEAKVRRHVNPTSLQSWALNLVALCSTSQVAETSFPVRTFPDYLAELHKLPPVGWVFPANPGQPGYVRVVWGSGFRGHWGLKIGATNFTDPYGTSSELWLPGVYFWRDYRP